MITGTPTLSEVASAAHPLPALPAPAPERATIAQATCMAAAAQGDGHEAAADLAQAGLALLVAQRFLGSALGRGKWGEGAAEEARWLAAHTASLHRDTAELAARAASTGPAQPL